MKGARVDLYNKSILHLAINFVTEVVNEGFFINIQLYSKVLELSLKCSKGVLILVQLSISLSSSVLPIRSLNTLSRTLKISSAVLNLFAAVRRRRGLMCKAAVPTILL